MKLLRVVIFSSACFLLLNRGVCGVDGQTGAEDLKVTIGKSLVLDYPADIGRISTSNPDIVDAMAVTKREILLHAKGYGTATVIVWDKSGQRSFYNLSVEQNLEPIRRILKSTFPGEDIQVQSARDTVALTGRVSSKAVSERATALVTPLVKSVTNNLAVSPQGAEKQILLRVKFAEVDRTLEKSFGMNILSTGATNTIGRVTTGQFNSASSSVVGGTGSSSFTLSDALNIYAFRPDLNLGAVIEALQAEGLLQILAEPNLVTTDGKEASFLVGGEFPIPVLQGGGSTGSVTIQFREFGIRLTFVPVITDHHSIKLYVKPEVSTIDTSNAVTFNGYTIPALSTRRVETNIELAEGQSFVIAGLIDDRVSDNISKIPGLANIPILGNLFKSKKEKKSKTELVVMVTPEITAPLDAAAAKPMPVMPKRFMAPSTVGKNSGQAATATDVSGKGNPAGKGH
jgi:pilus assembly protein CpaC